MSLMRFSPSVVRVGVAILLIASCRMAAAAANPDSESMTRAVNCLQRSQLPSGLLRYGFDFLQDAPLELSEVPPVQLTRQGVTSAALADYLVLTRDPGTAEAVTRLLTYFGKHELPIGRSGLQSFLAWTRVQSSPVGRWRIESALKRWGLLYETEGPGRPPSPDGNYANAYAGATGARAPDGSSVRASHGR